MKITLDIPESRFDKGDTISVPNRTNGGRFLYKVVAIMHNGRWSWSGQTKPAVDVDRASYVLKPQPGSVHDDTDAAPYGEAGGPDNEGVHVLSMAEVDGRATKL